MDRTHRELTDEDIARIADTYHAWRGEKEAGEYADVAGFCKSATLDDVRKHGHVLTPGRYVGAEAQEGDGEPFEDKMNRLTATLREQQADAAKLDAAIAANLRGLDMAGEWESYRLDELCEFINGFAFKSTDYVPPSTDAIEVFRMGYIQRGGGFKEDDSPVFVPQKYGKRLDEYLLRPDDITIAMTDMKDRVAILGNTAWIREAKRSCSQPARGSHQGKTPRFVRLTFSVFLFKLATTN